MRTLVVPLLALVCLNASANAADSKCGSFEARVPPPKLELAPPGGFVEVCGQDAALCKSVATGYPPEGKLVGYFVPAEEWKQYRAKQRTDFTRYLVALIAEGTEPAQFSELRAFLRARRTGAALDPKLPIVFDAGGRFVIPVFEDADDAMASGALIKRPPSGAKPAKETVLASTSIAYLAKDRVLSLYTYADVSDSPSAEPVMQLARDWLKCLRSAK
jgi:hypothetical protein